MTEHNNKSVSAGMLKELYRTANSGLKKQMQQKYPDLFGDKTRPLWAVGTILMREVGDSPNCYILTFDKKEKSYHLVNLRYGLRWDKSTKHGYNNNGNKGITVAGFEEMTGFNYDKETCKFKVISLLDAAKILNL